MKIRRAVSMFRVRIRSANFLRPKLLDLYILRELWPPFAIGLLVYSFVLMANLILQYPELFIAQGVSFADSTKLLLYYIPAVLAFTIPMAVIMGILAGLSRLSSDLETVAFKSLGVSQMRMVRPIFIFALIGWGATSVLTLSITPKFNNLLRQTVASAALEKVQIKVNPREFNQSVPELVLYLEDIDRNGEWKNAFIAFAGGPNESRVVLARRGRLNYYPQFKRATVELFDLVQHKSLIDDPKSYEWLAASTIEEEIDFSGIGGGAISTEKGAREQDIVELAVGLEAARSDLVRLEAEKAGLFSPDQDHSYTDRTRNLNAILKKEHEVRSLLVESHKRFALPFVCLIFVFLGLPLGLSTKKGGRTSGFTLSLVIIIAYYIFLTYGEGLAMSGRISPWLGIWGGNILLGAASIFLFMRSARERPLHWMWFRRRPDPSGFAATESRTEKKEVRGRAGIRRFRLELPFPNILDRYFMRRYFFIGGLIILSFVSISVIVTFFDRLDNVYTHKKPIFMLLQYIGHRLPEFIGLGLPVTALMATLLTLGLFHKFNEITAMKACGVSVYRVIAPAFVLSLFIGGLSFHIQENLLPRENQQAAETWNRIMDVPPREAAIQGRTWVTNKDRDRFFHYDYFDPKALTFGKFWVFDMDPAGWILKRSVYADTARIDGSSLRLENGWSREFKGSVISQPPAASFFTAKAIPLPEGRGLFLDESKDPSRMKYGELGRYIQEVEKLGFDATRLRVDRSVKLSFPFVAVIMTLLGIPFAFAMGKRGTLVGIGVSLGVALTFWMLIGVFKSLGTVGVLPIFLAAWGPPFFFGILGLYLIFRLKT